MDTQEIINFIEQQKESFYQKAEEYLEENGLECMKIDRTKFTYSGRDKEVRVYLLPFNKATVSREKLAHAKALKQVVITNDRYSKAKKGLVVPTRENGYIRFHVEEEGGN